MYVMCPIVIAYSAFQNQQEGTAIDQIRTCNNLHRGH